MGMTQPHAEPPPTPLIEEKHDGKSEKYFLKLKLRGDPTLPTSDLYEFKMYLFDNNELEEFLLFVRYFNTALAALGMLEAGSKYQYLCTIVRGEALRQFDSLSADVESAEILNVDYIIRGLAQYFPPVNSLSKQKRAMRRGMKKMRSLTVSRYAARLIDLNEYLASFPWVNLTDKIGVTELNEILLKSIPNSWSKQAYLQGFDFESVT